MNAASGRKILEIAHKQEFEYATIDHLGKVTQVSGAIEEHVRRVLALPLVNLESIKIKKFKVVLDAVNSSGGIAVPILMEVLGVTTVQIYCDSTGDFSHNPEPLKENLTELSEKVVEEKPILVSLLILMLIDLPLSMKMERFSEKNIHWLLVLTISVKHPEIRYPIFHLPGHCLT